MRVMDLIKQHLDYICIHVGITYIRIHLGITNIHIHLGIASMDGVHTAHGWCPHSTRIHKYVVSGTNGVAMGRNGPILSQDGATSLNNILECLPGHWNTKRKTEK